MAIENYRLTIPLQIDRRLNFRRIEPKTLLSWREHSSDHQQRQLRHD